MNAPAAIPAKSVIPAKAGIQRTVFRRRGNDGWLALFAGLFFALACSSPVFAQSTEGVAAPLQFEDAAEARRFRALVSELRCVMCQNQSLADSNALIALQLRREVLELMRKGMSDAQIKDYLVQRYGEFVLYKPKLEGGTLLLWIGPAVVLLAGAGVVAAIVRRRKPAANPAASDDGQEW